MSLKNDFTVITDNVFNDTASLNQRQIGKMSSYVRRQQSAIRSMRGSDKSKSSAGYSTYSKQSMFRPKQKLNFSKIYERQQTSMV
jgi:hypothetical protein